MEFKERSGYQKYFSKAHDMVRRSVRDFVKKEILPDIDSWEEQGEFPLELYRKAGEVGILGIGYPEALGGTPGDIFFKVAASEELMRSGSGGSTRTPRPRGRCNTRAASSTCSGRSTAGCCSTDCCTGA